MTASTPPITDDVLGVYANIARYDKNSAIEAATREQQRTTRAARAEIAARILNDNADVTTVTFRIDGHPARRVMTVTHVLGRDGNEIAGMAAVAQHHLDRMGAANLAGPGDPAEVTINVRDAVNAWWERVDQPETLALAWHVTHHA